MNNATPALLALLLVLSLPATSLVAADIGDGMQSEPAVSPRIDTTDHSTPTEVEDTTNRLELTEPVQNEYTTSGADLGASLAGVDDELRIDHEQYVLVDSTFDSADDDERAARLEDAYNTTSDRIAALEDREQAAVEEHAAGERTDRELIQTLLRNHHEAIALERTLQEIDDRSNEVSEFSLPSQDLNADEESLTFYQTPIQSSLAETSQTTESNGSFDLQIRTSEDGYQLSTIDDGNYVRETTRFDNRNQAAPDQFVDGDSRYPALDYAAELYPWADSNSQEHYRSAGYLYWVRFDHSHGELELYLDGGAGEVHREMQELSTTSLPVENEETHEVDGLELERHETPANGPVELTVTDGSSEVDGATVEIGDHVVGETDEDGTLWYVPPSESYELTVTPAGDSEGSTIDVSNA